MSLLSSCALSSSLRRIAAPASEITVSGDSAEARSWAAEAEDTKRSSTLSRCIPRLSGRVRELTGGQEGTLVGILPQHLQSAALSQP